MTDGMVMARPLLSRGVNWAFCGLRAHVSRGD